MIASKKKRIAQLITYGATQTQIAAAVGCTQGYVSLLLDSDEEMQAALAEEEAKNAIRKITVDTKLAKIENALMEQVASMVTDADSLGEATSSLQRICMVRERQQLRNPPGQKGGNVLELNLGPVANMRLEVAMGDKGTIISIGGKDMTRASPNKVKDMIDAHTPSKDVEDVEDYTWNLSTET